MSKNFPRFERQQIQRTVVPNSENPPKNKFNQGDFTRFSIQVFENFHNFRFRLPVLHIQNLSNRCRHNYDPSISQLFLNLIFGGLLQFGPTVQRCMVCKAQWLHSGLQANRSKSHTHVATVWCWSVQMTAVRTLELVRLWSCFEKLVNSHSAPCK